MLISCHPVLASVADTDSWSDVVYYGWDDWRTEDHGIFARAGGAIGRSYEQMAERDVNVIAVSRAIVDRIGARTVDGRPQRRPREARSTARASPPDWFCRDPWPGGPLDRAIEGRLDAQALAACARDLGGGVDRRSGRSRRRPGPLGAGSRGLPQRGREGMAPSRPGPGDGRRRARVPAPARPEPGTEAHESAQAVRVPGAGKPTVASDVPPVRGISTGRLVPPGVPTPRRAGGVATPPRRPRRRSPTSDGARLARALRRFRGGSAGGVVSRLGMIGPEGALRPEFLTPPRRRLLASSWSSDRTGRGRTTFFRGGGRRRRLRRGPRGAGSAEDVASGSSTPRSGVVPVDPLAPPPRRRWERAWRKSDVTDAAARQGIVDVTLP